MIDYLLRFSSDEEATQFGLVSGFTAMVDGEPTATKATPSFALCNIGEHYLPTGESDAEGNPIMAGDGFWWVLFRDVASGIPIPPGAENYIVWQSDTLDAEGNPVPRPEDAPAQMWA